MNARMFRHLLFIIGASVVNGQSQLEQPENGGRYLGRYIGPLSRLNHGVSGEVYAVDARTLHIKDFTYDGQGPAAFFYAGNSKAVGPGGFFIRDENGSNGVLKRYNKKHITITLPEGKTLNNIRWFSVWCEEFAVNFGDVQIPRGLDFPKPQKIGRLSGIHGVASDSIVIVDAQTLLIPSFSYDGEAPDAKFWVGRGPNPSPQGIRLPDENGKLNPLRRYEKKTIVLTLPGDLTVFDIGHFGVWCEAFTVDFGHVEIPHSLNVPPSLKMLGVSPQSKLNCEVLSDDLAYEVRWAVAGDSIVIQLVAKLEDGEYMSFGLSGHDERSQMIGGDVTVVWVEQSTSNGFAVDYFLDDKSQCSGTRGSCPDNNIEKSTDSVRLLNAALVNGYSIVTYQRPLRAADHLDRPIVTNRSQPVIWAVGPRNAKGETSYHSLTSKGDVFIDFGRPPKWNCPIPTETDATAESSSTHEGNVNNPPPVKQRQTESSSPSKGPAKASTAGAWDIPPIQCNEPDDGVFYAQMGPTGGKHGYPAITGHVGWGIAYYINGLLIPEIHVVRGKTYTFYTEGGNDASIPAKFHPFYITDDPVGGYQHKTPEERRKVNIYAGARLNKAGEVVPTGIGRMCNWTPDPNEPTADEFASFGAYQRTLTLACDRGDPGVIQWTPDRDTPDTVYYQCFSHRYLGWKIHVHDRCDLPPATSAAESVPSVVLSAVEHQDELEARPSVQVSTRLKPDFPLPQSLIQGKHPTKQAFPYEFMKPPPEVSNANGSVKPVREEYEDLPQSAPQNPVNTSSLIVKPNFQMQHSIKTGGNHMMMRVPYENLRPPPTRRPQVVMVRRPIQQGPNHMKPQIPHIPHMNTQVVHMAASQQRPVLIKKPVMKHPPRPPMVQVRPAQVSQNRPMMALPKQAQASKPMIYEAKPSFDTKFIQEPKPIKPAYIQKFKKTPPGISLSDKNKHKLHASQMISSNHEEITTKLPIAVNTGFNPGSLVMESGFKPIISTPVAEERISQIDYDEEEDNNEGVINMDSLEKSQTEMFEPMFIPSPLDSNTKQTKKATTQPLKKLRKPPLRQVIRRRPIYQDEPLFRSEPDDDDVIIPEEVFNKDNYTLTKEESQEPTVTATTNKTEEVEVVTAVEVAETTSAVPSRAKRSPHHHPDHITQESDNSNHTQHQTNSAYITLYPIPILTAICVLSSLLKRT